jgi:hypothetical protein
VQWNGINLVTTYISPTQLSAVIPSSYVENPGTAAITVEQGGVDSNALTFTITPPPTITAVTPSVIGAGSPNTPIVINGENFTPDSVISFDGTPIPTVYNSPSQIDGIIPSSLVSSPGAFPITVGVGGVSSSPYGFIVLPPPILDSLAPSTAIAGAADFSVTVSGQEFVPSAVVWWDGQALVTTYVSSTQLTAIVPAGLATSVGTFDVVVQQEGSTSNILPFTVVGPVLDGLSPSSAQAGSPGITITATGTNFLPDSQISWSGDGMVTTYVSPTTITATIPASKFIAAGSVSVFVISGGVSSNIITFTIAPVLSSVTPDVIIAGGPPVQLTLTGNGFVPGSVAKWDGVDMVTTYVSSTQLTAVTPTTIGPVGTHQVRVDVGSSSSNDFAVSVLQNPVLSSITPDNVVAGVPSLTLSATGQGFTSTTVLTWNGTSLPTTFVSDTQLTASVSAALVASAGTVPVTALMAWGAESNAINFTISAPPFIVSINPQSVPAGSPSFTLIVNGA